MGKACGRPLAKFGGCIHCMPIDAAKNRIEELLHQGYEVVQVDEAVFSPKRSKPAAPRHSCKEKTSGRQRRTSACTASRLSAADQVRSSAGACADFARNTPLMFHVSTEQGSTEAAAASGTTTRAEGRTSRVRRGHATGASRTR